MQRYFRDKLVPFALPISITSTAIGGDRNFISLANYDHATVLFLCGTVASAGNAITFLQAKNIEGNGSKALAFAKYAYCIRTTSPADEADLWQEVVASSLTTAGGVAYCFEIDGAMLDVDNGFDCFRPDIGSAASANLIACLVMLSRPRYLGHTKQLMPSSNVNSGQPTP